MKKLICIIMAAALLTLAGCGSGAPETDTTTTAAEEKTMAFTVTSQSIGEDGFLSLECADKSKGGKNISPEMTWTAVEGAAVYAVYIFDTSAGNWNHLIATDLTETSYAAGSFGKDKIGRYVGPYPPSGTHNYQITVYALKAPADEYKANYDSENDVSAVEAKLDVAGGEAGNIIAKAYVIGKFTA